MYLRIIVVSTALLGLFAAGCSDSNPVSSFQPEIINNPDAFEFQITGANNVSTVLAYNWTNSGERATVDHSTALTEGVAMLAIYDAGGTQVYSSNLKASGTETAATGKAGIWSIRVSFSDFAGSSNFRVQKL